MFSNCTEWDCFKICIGQILNLNPAYLILRQFVPIQYLTTYNLQRLKHLISHLIIFISRRNRVTVVYVSYVTLFNVGYMITTYNVTTLFYLSTYPRPLINHCCSENIHKYKVTIRTIYNMHSRQLTGIPD